MSITLSKKHGVAPALTFCRICGKDTNEIALLGAKADRVMKELFEQTKGAHGNEHGYSGNSCDKVPSTSLCDECEGVVKEKGIIFIAKDTGEFMRLGEAQVDTLIGRVQDAKGRVLDFESIKGKVVNINKAFWQVNEQGDIILRDPKDWTE